MRDIMCKSCKVLMAPTKHNIRLKLCEDCELE